jgi:4-amino-4-deoxy-L-arabinose transferase-like glycosyltransferase
MASALDRDDRRQFWLFMLAAFIVLAAGLGLRDPWPPDEPRFTLIAHQMVESGNWLFPQRGHELYSDKPPMLMWLEAAAFTVLGNWRIAFLLPSLLAGLGTLALTWDLGRRLWNRRVGIYAGVLLLATMQFVAQSKRAQIDPLVMLWITLGNWGVLVHCLRGPNWRAFWLGCFAAGLGVITKGVGILALFMLIPYAVMRARRWPGVTVTGGDGWRWAGGALAFLLAIAVWLAPMLLVALHNDEPSYRAYVNDILFRQTAGRYAASWQHHEPFWYFAPVLIVEWFPLCLLYLPMLPRWRDAFRQRDAKVVMPLVWVLITLVFFSIPSGKREVYLLPAIPMAALAMASFMPELMQARWLRRLSLALALLAGFVLLGGGLWAAFGHPKFAERLADRELPDHARAFWLAIALMGAGFLVAAAWLRARGATLVVGMGVAWIVWSLFVYPQFNPSESTLALMQKVDARLGPQGELGLVAWREEHLLLAPRHAEEFGFSRGPNAQMTDAIAWQAKAPDRRWIFSSAEALGPCVDRTKAIDLGKVNRYGWWMFPASAVIAGCDPMKGSAIGVE